MKGLKSNFMKIEFENSIRKLSFLRHLPDVKISNVTKSLIKNVIFYGVKVSFSFAYSWRFPQNFIAVAF